MAGPLTIRRVAGAADRRRFVDLVWDIYRGDPAWVPPLKSEVHALIDPAKNPWFGHARAEFFLAEQDRRTVGRISAQVDQLAISRAGPGTGHWGMFEAADAQAAAALIAAAEQWLRVQGMVRALGPISLSMWDEPGLLVEGFDQPPTVMMGHHRAEYRGWIEAAGYSRAKDLVTYEVDIRAPMVPMIERLIASGRRNPRIRVRTVDKSRFAGEAATILTLLNDAWSGNWGFVPFTDAEVAYAARKLKPIIFEDLVRIAEVDEGSGEGFRPAAFMLTIPDINQLIVDLDGRLFPLGWAKLLWRLRRPRTERVRVPLMGVATRFHGTRLATQLAFMMIEETRLAAIANYGARLGEFGWILEDNLGMLSIAELPGATINKRYRIFEKPL